MLTGLHSALDSMFDCRSRGHKQKSQLRCIIVLEIYHEIISAVIFMIQEGELSVTGKGLCTNYWLTAVGLG